MEDCGGHIQKSFQIVIHGGAGVIAKELDPSPYKASLIAILKSAYLYANESGQKISALDIAEHAVKLMEDDILFNAGLGSVYAADGSHELEASVMDGSTLQCGAVSMLKHVRYPITAARLVMEHTPHVYLVGSTAEGLAFEHGVERVESSYFDSNKRLLQLQEAQKQHGVFNDHDLLELKERSTGTVGCVCMYNGAVAAATSTGGMTNKMPGRIGDTPLIGAGTYADNTTCAVSATGQGEEFIRHCVAYDVSARMKYANQSILDAAHDSVFSCLPKDCGGVIAVDANGQYATEFNSLGMFRGGVNHLGSGFFGIWEEVESLKFNCEDENAHK